MRRENGRGELKYFGGKVVSAVKSTRYFFDVDSVCHLNAYLDADASRNRSGEMPQKWIWSPDQEPAETEPDP
jgi:hypothetical protein